MLIRFGYDIAYDSAPGVLMVVMLAAQPNATQRIVRSDELYVAPSLSPTYHIDGFGNTCARFVCRGGAVTLKADGLIEDSGVPEAAVLDALEVPVESLPSEVFSYLLGSRYCETDLLMNEAWRLFGHIAPGWNRVQAICDFVNQHVAFGYRYASSTKTAYQTYVERQGVCRDMAHLAIALCRCINIPARYCTSYLGDIGVQTVDAPMDFAACMEVYLGHAWHSFDPRNNARRIGRIMIARGRDAADVAFSTAFGHSRLRFFRVWTEEVIEQRSIEVDSTKAA
ncbi:MAG: transglutaminase family protein [Steroidobacteraceae bacterium]|jgi:transglutaminase-like putative cysteine protease